MSVVAVPPAAPASFPKSVRIRKRSEYLRVQDGGRKLQTPSFLVFVRPAAPSSPTEIVPAARFGVTVTRKIGVAVVRNRIKRLMREALRRHKLWFPVGRELVFVAKRSASGLCYSDLERELETLCRAHFATT